MSYFQETWSLYRNYQVFNFFFSLISLFSKYIVILCSDTALLAPLPCWNSALEKITCYYYHYHLGLNNTSFHTHIYGCCLDPWQAVKCACAHFQAVPLCSGITPPLCTYDQPWNSVGCLQIQSFFDYLPCPQVPIHALVACWWLTPSYWLMEQTREY